MGLACKITGHKWDGCTCARCGEHRDTGVAEDHNYVLVPGTTCEYECTKCGKHTMGHSWYQDLGCTCTVCGATREVSVAFHEWDGCTCKLCGKTRDEGHRLEERALGSIDSRRHRIKCKAFCVLRGSLRYEHGVLLDDDFAVMPSIVAEGRRSINNLQRSAVLYLTKTLYSIALAVLFVPLFLYDYPFAPVQLTVLSFFTIGFPSFVLALEPNRDRNRGRFLRNVVMRSIPGAVAVVVVIVASIVAGAVIGATQEQFQTMCVFTSALIGMTVVLRQSQPFNVIRTVLFIVCSVGLLISVFGMGSFLMLSDLTVELGIAVIAISAVAIAIFNVVYSWVIKRQKRYLDALEAEQIREREVEFAEMAAR